MKGWMRGEEIRWETLEGGGEEKGGRESRVVER